MNVNKLSIITIFIFVFIGYSAADISNKAKEAIEKARLGLERNINERKELKNNVNAKNTTVDCADIIPGMLVYKGRIEKLTVDKKSASIFIVKLKDGTTVIVPAKSKFIREGKILQYNNVLPGLEVAIVNKAPEVPLGIIGGEVSKNIPLVVTATTIIYCGNDSENLEKYYPSSKINKKPATPAKTIAPVKPAVPITPEEPGTLEVSQL